MWFVATWQTTQGVRSSFDHDMECHSSIWADGNYLPNGHHWRSLCNNGYLQKRCRGEDSSIFNIIRRVSSTVDADDILLLSHRLHAENQGNTTRTQPLVTWDEGDDRPQTADGQKFVYWALKVLKLPRRGHICPSVARSSNKSFLASCGLHPSSPKQRLFSWTPLRGSPQTFVTALRVLHVAY